MLHMVYELPYITNYMSQQGVKIVKLWPSQDFWLDFVSVNDARWCPQNQKFNFFFWILFPRMTLGDIPIFGFCFRDLPIWVKVSSVFDCLILIFRTQKSQSTKADFKRDNARNHCACPWNEREWRSYDESTTESLEHMVQARF